MGHQYTLLLGAVYKFAYLLTYLLTYLLNQP